MLGNMCLVTYTYDKKVMLGNVCLVIYDEGSGW